MITDECMVLRKLDYAETSQIVALFTKEHGKVRAIAKGIKRGTKTRFAVGMDLLDTGLVTINLKPGREENLAQITDWKPNPAPIGLRAKLFRLYASLYAIDLTAQLTEDRDAHPELFAALGTFTANMADAEEPYSELVGLQVRLLRSIGSLPRFDACVRCGRMGQLSHFSSFQGGMICRPCSADQEERRPVTPETLAAMARRAQPDSWFGPFRLLNYHLTHLMGRPSRLAHRLLKGNERKRAE